MSHLLERRDFFKYGLALFIKSQLDQDPLSLASINYEGALVLPHKLIPVNLDGLNAGLDNPSWRVTDEEKLELVRFSEEERLSEASELLELNIAKIAKYLGLDEGAIRDAFERYGLLYIFAGEIFKIPWYVLFLTHRLETNFSRDFGKRPNGFHGAMQRDPDFYPDEYADEISEGLNFFKLLEGLRDERDWIEIIFAASKMRADFNEIVEYFSQPKRVARFEFNRRYFVREMFLHYCREDHAEERFNLYKLFKEIFGNYGFFMY